VPNTAVLLEPSSPSRPSGSRVSDAVQRAQAGDEDAFAELYREHVGRVYALCLRLTSNVADAKERTQDVFVRAWERLPSFRGESAFPSWLHRLAVNEVLMEFRRTKRRELRIVPDADLPEPAALSAPAGTRLDLEAAIGALPPGARQVLVLHDIEGYRHGEIGEMLGIAEGTSKAHLFRAHRLLREALDR
jgi:RNA polymerase sigma-70 factor (ECF subfamily)